MSFYFLNLGKWAITENSGHYRKQLYYNQFPPRKYIKKIDESLLVIANYLRLQRLETNEEPEVASASIQKQLSRGVLRNFVGLKTPFRTPLVAASANNNSYWQKQPFRGALVNSFLRVDEIIEIFEYEGAYIAYVGKNPWKHNFNLRQAILLK